MEETKYEAEEKRIIEDYISAVKKNTDLFSTNDPEILIDEILNFLEAKGYKYELAKGRYKIKLQILLGD
jgi:hypothetical protein